MDIRGYLADSGLMRTTKSTYERYLCSFQRWLERNDLSAESFDGQDFDRFVEERHANWSERTQEICLDALKSWALWEFGEAHPIRRKRIHVPQPDNPRVLSEREARCFLGAIDRSSDIGKRDFAIVRLLLECGLRASEVGKIKTDKVDLSAGRLSVLQKQGRIHRPVFGDQVRAAFEDWIGVRKRHAINGSFFVSLGGPDPGTAIKRSGVYNIFRTISLQTGIKASPHTMRYTFVDHALRRGVPMKVIAAQGGWQSIKTVERYARGLDPEVFRGFLRDYE